jgi:hypothetical protein
VSDDGGPVPSRDEQGRTQTGRALVLVVVVALVAVLVLRHTGSSAAGPTRSTRAAGATRSATSTTTTTTTVGAQPTTSTTVAALIPPADTTVEVLNGFEAGPLASNLSGRLRRDGYKTLAPYNAMTLTTTSAIYVVQSAYYPEAERLATTLGLAPLSITRGLPAGAPVPPGAATGSDLIVVIGTSLHALASRSVTPTTTSTTSPPTTVASTTASSTTGSSTTVASSTSTSTTTRTSTSTATGAPPSTSTTAKPTATTAP